MTSIILAALAHPLGILVVGFVVLGFGSGVFKLVEAFIERPEPTRNVRWSKLRLNALSSKHSAVIACSKRRTRDLPARSRKHPPMRDEMKPNENDTLLVQRLRNYLHDTVSDWTCSDGLPYLFTWPDEEKKSYLWIVLCHGETPRAPPPLRPYLDDLTDRLLAHIVAPARPSLSYGQVATIRYRMREIVDRRPGTGETCYFLPLDELHEVLWQ